VRLRLDSVNKQVGAATHLHTCDLELQSGAINVLLGATLAGKTSLLRIMAGLDRPSSGRVLVDDRDVTGISVRHRNLAMVYQQFINYPSLSVFENIASPLRLQRLQADAIRRRVAEVAEALHLTPYLDRRPAELSGGQQQRLALARALAKNAELLLLDEPLVNLDYKLREELRAELAQLFRNGRTTVVYATTEPQEALQLGGHTAIIEAGKILQYGPTLKSFLHPASLAAARVFSDPPLNVLPADRLRQRATAIPLTNATQLGIRAHCLSAARRSDDDLALEGRVELTEIGGSETYLHVAHEDYSLVAQLSGVHSFAIGANCSLYVNPADIYGFGARDELLFAPGMASG